MAHLLDTILTHLPAPRVLGGAAAPFRMSVNLMEVAEYVGKLVVGREAHIAPGIRRSSQSFRVARRHFRAAKSKESGIGK
jgi:predicted membrane GTPase involved in stress response